MFGSKVDRPKSKIYSDLMHGDTIVPRHQSPKVIGDTHPTLAGEADRLLFADFVDFGHVLNWWLADTDSRWRAQELPITELSIGFHDSPSYGRRFELFCGPTKLGLLEISTSYPYNPSQKNVLACIELRWVRLLPWDLVTDLLGSVATHINSQGDTSNVIKIQSAMTRALWDSFVITDQDLGTDWGSLELTLQGTADFYFSRKDSDHFRGTRN